MRSMAYRLHELGSNSAAGSLGPGEKQSQHLGIPG